MSWTPAEREVLRRFANTLRHRMLDETPSGNGGSDYLTLAEERGYRHGHNDATRAIIREADGIEAGARVKP